MITAERCQIMSDFIASLEADERNYWLQQNGAMAHTAASTVEFSTHLSQRMSPVRFDGSLFLVGSPECGLFYLI